MKANIKPTVKHFVNDFLGQLWTLTGMFVAWVVLEGTAKEVVGWVIIGSIVVWVISFPFRHKLDKD